jgi:hypothetical protein
MQIKSAVITCGLLLAAACAHIPTAEEKALLERGTPLLDRLAGGPVLPGKQTLSARVLAARADEAFYRGQTANAVKLLARAEESLPVQSAPCSVRGGLLYVQGLAAQFYNGNRDEQGWKKLREICLDAEVPVSDEASQAFFRSITAQNPASATVAGDQEDDLADSKNLAEKQWIDRMVKTAGLVGGTRGQILNRYAAWLLVVKERQTDRCDKSFTERHRRTMNEAYDALAEAGRPDLAIGWWSTALVLPDGRLDPAASAQLTQWITDSDNRWVRTYALARVLAAIRYASTWADPLLTAPLCKVLYADLGEQLDADRDDGFNSRNAQRLMEAFNASGACLHQHELTTMLDRGLAISTEGNQGAMGVLQVVGGLGVNIVVEMISGRSDTAYLILGRLLQSLDKFRTGLGNTADERALSAILDILVASPAALQGRLPALIGTVENAASLFDGLTLSPPAAETSDFLRLVPGIRAMTVGSLALLQWLNSDEAAAKASLQRLKRNAEGDLAAILEFFEQPNYAPQLLGILEAITVLLKDSDGDAPVDGVKLSARLSAALKAGEAESGWWAVGLDLLRAAAWDIYALVAHERKLKDIALEALVNGETLSTSAVNRCLELVEMPYTVATILKMLPSLHQAVPDLMNDSLEGDALMRAVAVRLDAPLRELSGQLKKPLAGRSVQVADLFNELLIAAIEVGLENLITEPKQALAQMVTTLDTALDRYPPDIRVFLELISAVAHFYHDVDQGEAAFARVAETAGQGLPELAFMPRLLQASLRRAEGAPAQELLALTDAVMKHGEASEKCDEGHAVHALLPGRMWLFEQAGDHGAARGAYLHFVDRVDKGFPGDVPLNCVLESNASHFIFTVNLGNATAGFLVPGKSEGTFQVGLGTSFGGDSKPMGDDLTCSASYGKAVRYDRIMETHLAWTVYALLHHERKEAHGALLKALAVGRKLANGSNVTLGLRASTLLQDSRTKLDLTLVVWTALLARLNGLGQSADVLESLALQIGTSQEAGYAGCLPEDDTPPTLLQNLPAITDFGPLVKKWFTTRTRKDAKAYRKELLAFGKKHRLFDRWGVDLVSDSLLDYLPAEERDERSRTLKGPGKGPGAEALKLRNLLVATGLDQKVPEIAELKAVFQALTARGMYGETAGPLARMAVFLNSTGDSNRALALIEFGLELIPDQEAPVVTQDLLTLYADLLVAANRLNEAYSVYQRLVPELQGYGAAQTEMTARWTLARLHGMAGHYGPLHAEVLRLLPMFQLAYGSSNTLYYTLLTLDVALRFLGSQSVSIAALEALEGHGRFVLDSAAQSSFIKQLREAPDPLARKQLSGDFLKAAFPPQ